jgi:hypothetical protein
MDDPFVAAHIKAISDYLADLEQIQSLGDRLIANAKGVRKEKTSDRSKCEKLSTIRAQLERLPQSRKESEGRFLKARDAANELYVIRVKGLTAYCMGTHQDDAATRLLASICKDFDRAKGDFPRRQALYDEITATMSAAVAALDKQETATWPLNSKIAAHERISDPEQASGFYKQHREEILSEFQARQNQQP